MDISFSTVTQADAESLVAIRIEAMRESLTDIGRFDPDRARNRFLSSFTPENCRLIRSDGHTVGFFTLLLDEPTMQLQHLYILPRYQNRGIGSAVLGRIFSQADQLQRPVKVGALRGSASNRLYQRHQFVKLSEDEWDVYYLRQPQR